MIGFVLKLFKKRIAPKYYDSINEISVFNWDKCTSGELEYTRVNISKGNEVDDLEAWDDVFDSYLKRYGQSTPHELLLDIQTELALVQCDFIESGDRFLLNKIAVLSHEIEEVLKRDKGKGLDTSQVLIIASKWMGSMLKPEDTTVQRLHDILDMIRKEYNQNKALQDANKKK